MNGPRICTTLDPSRHDTHLNGLFSQLACVDVSTLVAACTDSSSLSCLCQWHSPCITLRNAQASLLRNTQEAFRAEINAMARHPKGLASSIAALTWFSICGSTPIMADNPPPIRIPTRGGEVVISTPAEHTAYDDWNYAPARRAGDYVYVSGVVVGRQADGPRTPETFKDTTRRAFATLRARLQALGADFADVVMINTFHDWSAPEFHGNRMAQFTAFREVKAEFMPTPHPAWTAVGTSGLIREAGIVEVQMIAYAPQRKSATSSATESPTSSKMPTETTTRDRSICTVKLGASPHSPEAF
jgi:enamine deaminase RidA (YjgF/YER057c/UK114 family)